MFICRPTHKKEHVLTYPPYDYKKSIYFLYQEYIYKLQITIIYWVISRFDFKQPNSKIAGDLEPERVIKEV